MSVYVKYLLENEIECLLICKKVQVPFEALCLKKYWKIGLQKVCLICIELQWKELFLQWKGLS